jgi:hypothetical protein
MMLIPMPARFAGAAGSNPAGRHGFLSLTSVVCCQVEVSATDRSLAQRSPTECVSACDRGTSEGNLRPLGLSSHEKEK